MAQIIPIYIPTYINNAEYAPARVLPRLLFYNGKLECEKYFFESGSLTEAGISIQQNYFPYFDNYNVVQGQFPTEDSLSLLFNNEAPSYGILPLENLYTTYWETYITLLYNPYTRLLNTTAIIPLKDYFNMELNDIVNFRGNYYHLRAINNYSLKTGDCDIQLLGPIIPDTFAEIPKTYGNVSWSFNETNLEGSLVVKDKTTSTTLASLTADGSGNAVVETYDVISASVSFDDYPAIFTGSITMSLIVSSSEYSFSQIDTISGSTIPPKTIQTRFSVKSGTTYTITGDIQYNISGSTPPTGSATSSILDWSYTQSYGATGENNIYINDVAVISDTSSDSGVYEVFEGDVIYVDMNTTGCSGATAKANCSTSGIIVDASCADSSSTLTTTTYTVVSGDLGTTLNLDCYSSCNDACL